MLKAVFFDLDSTLLPMDEEKFMGIYLHSLYNYVKSLGFEENKFAKDIFTGVKIMMTNDGSRTNEEAFWSFFKAQYGKDIVNHIDLFESYYKTDFKLTKGACEPNELAKKIVCFVKENGLLCILSTNPLFPIVANETRLGFIGLATNDFDYITSYENSSYCKPNPKYFEALLNKFHLSASEVIAHTIVNGLAIIAGMVCDGAKPSCAAKIAAAVDAGIFGYQMYKSHQEFRDGEGLVTKGVDNTIYNISQMAREGMSQTDDEILKIMVGKKCDE